MPPNYREQRDLPLQAHERKAAVVIAGTLVAAGIAAGGWALAATGQPHKGKCVAVVLAGATGGGTLERCGADARTWCKTEATVAGATAALVRSACRRAGLAPS